MATALEWDWDVSLSPFIPGSAAGKAQKEYLSLPKRAHALPHGSILRRWELGSRTPAGPAGTLSQRWRQPGSAWFWPVRRGDVSFWHCSPALAPCSPGSRHWQWPRWCHLWDWPRSRDQPSRGPAVALVPPLLNSVSDMSSGLKVVDWLLLSLKKESKHIHIWLGKRHVTAATATNTGKISSRAGSPSSTWSQPTVIPPKYHTGFCSWDIKPWSHALAGEKGRCVPSKPLPEFQIWRMAISHLLLTFQTTSWFPWPFSWNLEMVVSSANYLLLLGEEASQPDPSGLQIPSLFQLLENKSFVKTLLCRTVQTCSRPWEWLLLNYWLPPCQENGARGMGRSMRNATCPSFMGLAGNAPRQCSASVKHSIKQSSAFCTQGGKIHLVNQAGN